MLTTQEIIRFFQMKPLPDEGGYYVETYRAKGKIAQANLPAGYSGRRNFSTAILYLLTPDTFSRLHRVKSDEVFHFYLGDPVTMLQLHPDSTSKIIILGQDVLNGQCVQAAVPAGIWQGCFLNQGGKFALLGCTVSPGFEFADYESGHQNELLDKYPNQQNLIIQLTR
jgi:predicted cupin superfamily sugar epimerase